MPDAHSPYPMDPIVERRLSILETQVGQMFTMLAEIKATNTEIFAKVSSTRGNTDHIEGQIQELIKDMAELKTQVASLDTISFFVRNPKVALSAAIGFAFFFIQDFRETILNIFKAFFSDDL